jgi:hypothetical protein
VYNSDTGRSVTLDEIRNAGWIPTPTSLARDKLDPTSKKQVPDWRFFVSPTRSNEQRTTNNEQRAMKMQQKASPARIVFIARCSLLVVRCVWQ